jgi:hypothetical protein
VLDAQRNRPLCETRSTWLWLRRDASGGYQDKTLLSTVTPLGVTGEPSCRYCQEAVGCAVLLPRAGDGER